MTTEVTELPDDINELDRLALERCVEVARRDPKFAEVLDEKARDEAWFDIAVAACSRVQSRTMNLDPWESPPVWAHVARPGRDDVAINVLARMLAAGVSRYSPDPLRELADAEARLREPAK